MQKVELHIIALAESESRPNNFALILEERGGFRRLPIVIGPFEAQAIAIYLERIPTSRPLTHDLFKTTLDQLNVKIKEAFVHSLVDGVFHAQLIGKKEDGTEILIDARSSDAIALALRFECPIYTSSLIMEEAGFVLEDPKEAFTSTEKKLSDYSITELERMLRQVVEEEDYTRASKIRDAIAEKKRNS